MDASGGLYLACHFGRYAARVFRWGIFVASAHTSRTAMHPQVPNRSLTLTLVYSHGGKSSDLSRKLNIRKGDPAAARRGCGLWQADHRN